jgi:ATP-dependent DNA helicase RecQ
VCDNDIGKQKKVILTDACVRKLQEFRETYFPVLEVEAKHSHIINGVAGSYYGISNVGAALRHSKYGGGGDFPDWLLRLTLKAFRKYYGNMHFDLILYVPPTESGDLVKNFAEKVASILKIPISHKLMKKSPTEPQKDLKSAISKKENVHGKFEYLSPSEMAGKHVLDASLRKLDYI